MTIELLGVTYPVLWDDEAMRVALQLTGYSPTPHPDTTSVRDQLQDLGIFLYAALSAAAARAGEQPPLSLEQVHESLGRSDPSELAATADTIAAVMRGYGQGHPAH